MTDYAPLCDTEYIEPGYQIAPVSVPLEVSYDVLRRCRREVLELKERTRGQRKRSSAKLLIPGCGEIPKFMVATFLGKVCTHMFLEYVEKHAGLVVAPEAVRQSRGGETDFRIGSLRYELNTQQKNYDNRSFVNQFRGDDTPLTADRYVFCQFNLDMLLGRILGWCSRRTVEKMPYGRQYVYSRRRSREIAHKALRPIEPLMDRLYWDRFLEGMYNGGSGTDAG